LAPAVLRHFASFARTVLFADARLIALAGLLSLFSGFATLTARAWLVTWFVGAAAARARLLTGTIGLSDTRFSGARVIGTLALACASFAGLLTALARRVAGLGAALRLFPTLTRAVA
jgi:hypothetical protein